MMLKINKTLPKSKARINNSSNKLRLHYLYLATLICGIMPGLMVLSNYNIPEVSAVGYDITQISTMQEMTPTICDNTAVGTEAMLTDTRDKSTYTVAKLSDGKCWMTQNLRIVNKTITPEDSDVTEDFTIPNEPTNFIGENNIAAYYSGNEAYGAYYSWYTAVANTRKGLTSGEAPGSICPKGWKLPTSSNYAFFVEKAGEVGTKTFGDTSYQGRYIDDNDTKVFFPFAGYRYDSTLTNTDVDVYYWTRSIHDVSHAANYGVGKTDSKINEAVTDYSGMSVRCVANWPSKDVNVVAVRVAPVISIDTVSGMKSDVEPHKITEGSISATISANTTYDVLLSANETSLINSEESNSTETLPSIPASSEVKPNNNAWGILNDPTLTNNTHTYSPITTTPTTYYNTEQYDETKQSTTHTFGIGVSISPSLPSGEYSTTVTITAVNN